MNWTVQYDIKSLFLGNIIVKNYEDVMTKRQWSSALEMWGNVFVIKHIPAYRLLISICLFVS